MPPSQNKTNFRTYESSVRLLAAVLASAKPKLNFAELAALMGGGTTASAVDHRLRPVKQLGKMQLTYKNANKDPGELPIETQEIQKLYGESTAGGIEWQFREIKALGKAQQQAVEAGDNPAELTVGNCRQKLDSTTSTPATAKKTANGSATGSKRKRGVVTVNISDDDSGDDGAESNYDAKDVHSGEENSDQPPASKRRSTAKKTNGNGAAKGTKAVARKLFPAKSKSAKLGKGFQTQRVNTFNLTVIDVDTGAEKGADADKAEDKAEDAKADRKNPQRSCRVKSEVVESSEENYADSPNGYASAGADVQDDLSDGEA